MAAFSVRPILEQNTYVELTLILEQRSIIVSLLSTPSHVPSRISSLLVSDSQRAYIHEPWLTVGRSILDTTTAWITAHGRVALEHRFWR